MTEPSGSWACGDMVRMKSGGPSMIVDRFDAAQTVWCKWQEGETLRVGCFYQPCLEKIVQQAPSPCWA